MLFLEIVTGGSFAALLTLSGWKLNRQARAQGARGAWWLGE